MKLLYGWSNLLFLKFNVGCLYFIDLRYPLTWIAFCWPEKSVCISDTIFFEHQFRPSETNFYSKTMLDPWADLKWFFNIPCDIKKEHVVLCFGTSLTLIIFLAVVEDLKTVGVSGCGTLLDINYSPFILNSHHRWG